MEFSVANAPRGPWTVVSVGGEVDVATAPRLREELINLVAGGHNHLVVDLEGLDFIDSTGLGVLVGALKRTRSNDGELRVVCTHSRILKVFEITGLDSVFGIAATIEEVTGTE